MGDSKDITVVTDALLERSKPLGPPCLVVFYGENIGLRHPLDQPEVIIGRAGQSEIHIDHNSVSRQHAKIETNEGHSRISDLGSTNGTYVNDVRVDSIDLRDGDIVRIGNVIFKYLSGTNIEAKYHEEIYRLTTIDGLTNAYNKRYFLETLERELNRAHRYRRWLSLVMLDVDHFKRVNDTYGHLAGDDILRELAKVVADNLRREDIFARYGGEEFAIILPEIDTEGAANVSEKLRELVATHRFDVGESGIQVTVSLGVMSLVPGEDLLPLDDFISRADGKLYDAKRGGRNRVVA